MSHSPSNLIELRHHYEAIIAQSQYQASQAKEQLAHIDALLVNGLLQTQALPSLPKVIAPSDPSSSVPALSAQAEASDPRTALEFTEDFSAQAEPPSSREALLEKEPISQGSRVPRTLLPAYQGMKRLEAIAKVLQTTPGQEVTIDSLSQALFGDLSESDRISERKRLYTLLYQGEKRGLWEKGKSPYSYLIGKSKVSESKASEDVQSTPQVSEPKFKASTAKASSTTVPQQGPASSGQGSLSLLPVYEGMNKLEAIAQVLTEQSGHVLHQDTIFQLLYGEVSPEVLSKESKRMRASLFQGVTKGLWDKASTQPSSYIAKTNNGRKPKATAVVPSPATPKREASASTNVKANSEGNRSVPAKTASRGRTQVLSLPAQYAGLSKIETVAKVLEENQGKTMHMDEIIEHLYGKLSGEDLKAEKVRMKDVMTRGVQRQLWNKAQGVPSSIVAVEPKQRRAATEALSTAAKVTKLDPSTSKKPRKAASAKTSAKPKRKQAEVVALLKKANIKV
jgi:hypothetical protein